MIHTLHASMEIAVPIDKVFEFFADASNLQRITPSQLGFEIISPQPTAIEKGAVMDYRIHILGLPIRWRALISYWNPPHEFVDEQIHGPYKSWKHIHRFEPANEGTRIEDEVHYALPLAPFGELAFPLVKMQLKHIFTFRRKAIETLFANQ